MNGFGDVDPEDAWDDVDPFPVRLALLARIVDAVESDDTARRRRRAVDALRLVAKLDAVDRGRADLFELAARLHAVT